MLHQLTHKPKSGIFASGACPLTIVAAILIAGCSQQYDTTAVAAQVRKDALENAFDNRDRLPHVSTPHPCLRLC